VPVAVACVFGVLLAASMRLPGLGAGEGPSEAALRLPSAIAGALGTGLAALVAAELAGPVAAFWAGGLIALSPIYTLASREATPEAPLVLILLLALWLVVRVEASGRNVDATALGLAVGGLAVSGVAAFAAVAILLPAWAALSRERRGVALLAALVALAMTAAAGVFGLARSPFDYGDIPPWMPATTLAGVVRCTGASFTRVVGLEYHLAVSQARYVLPLLALFVVLMLRGAARLPARTRGLLVAGTLLPFAFGAAMALITGRVTPLQANRLLAALPFVAVLMATSLASLRGTRAWAAGTTVAGTLVAFLALALAR